MSPDTPALIRVRIDRGWGSAIDRAVAPTPYEVQLLAEDLSCARRGGRVEIDDAGASSSVVELLEAAMAKLASRGVEVAWSSRAPRA